jgi:hypothetical protein
MKKAAKVEYGIEIVKPWSPAMYAHNDEVAEAVKNAIHRKWANAYDTAEQSYESYDEGNEIVFQDMEWDAVASEDMIAIQKAVTCYGFGFGFAVGQVAETVEDEIEEAPYFRLKDMAEELELVLEKGFVGF